MGAAEVMSVSLSARHGMGKLCAPSIRLVAGLGVEGDAHHGATVQHRSRVRLNPRAPNLRQVHLLHAELLDELNGAGFALAPGVLGENVLLRGVELLLLPAGARLRLGAAALVELTGLRNPCHELDLLRPGLMAATLGRDAQGELVRKAGVMAIVMESGDVRPGDPVAVELPPPPHRALAPV